MSGRIISINGRIGSGKDTVGKIIQYLVFCKHFELTNDAFDPSQKSTYGLSGWEIKKFAGKLKQIASILTGIPVDKFEDQEFKKTYLSEEWNWITGFNGKEFTKDPVVSGMEDRCKKYTVRDFLQKLGTECMRDRLHTNIWVNALFSDFKYATKCDGYSIDEKYPNWIITDLRFPNEYIATKNRGGITIRVNREGTKKENEHISEKALDHFFFDYEIDNNGTMGELIEKVKQILIVENIL